MSECIKYISIARLTHISLEEKPTKQEKESGGTTEVTHVYYAELDHELVHV
jgi:hypothetical protein